MVTIYKNEKRGFRKLQITIASLSVEHYNYELLNFERKNLTIIP
jgi:hypothetical protein